MPLKEITKSGKDSLDCYLEQFKRLIKNPNPEDSESLKLLTASYIRIVDELKKEGFSVDDTYLNKYEEFKRIHKNYTK